MNTIPPKLNLPTTILLMITALGIPSVAAWAFADQIVQQPWQALGLALGYELLVLVGGMSMQIWQKLQERWVDRIVDKIDGLIQGRAPGYRGRYLKNMVFRHRNFDVKGLTTQGIYTLELQKVFVELRIAPRSPHEISTDPIPVRMREAQGQKPIWEYLRSRELKNLAIIGPPGSGKTTLLKHVTLTLSMGMRARHSVRASKKLPILLFLRDHADHIIKNSNYRLENAIHENLAQKHIPQPPANWFPKQLRAGKCLILLDGLDEVANIKVRNQVTKWVEDQMMIYTRCRFVITSRPHGYRNNPIEGVTVLEVRPFNQQQIERFVHNWYLANEVLSAGKNDRGVLMEAQSGAKDLLERLRRTPTLSELAINPLLLTMISTVHRYRSSLPGRRVELYAEVCEVFLGKRQASKGLIQHLTPAQKRRVLQVLAYHLMLQGRREIRLDAATPVIARPLALVTGKGDKQNAQAFLKSIEDESGLLIEREAGEYSFSHLAFQEYLASVHIQDQRLEEKLTAQVENSWWHEVIRLYCAQADATLIVTACLSKEPLSVPALTLAIECVDEAKEIDPALRIQLEELLTKGVESDDE